MGGAALRGGRTSSPSSALPLPEGHYLHMDSNTFHRGGVARLQSPPLWVQGPLCVYFAYHMFGLSWGAQLKLLLLRDTKKKHPSLLWKHINTQRPSWMPTAVTVPMGLVLPSRVRARTEPWTPIGIQVEEGGEGWAGGPEHREGSGLGHLNSGRTLGA